MQIGSCVAIRKKGKTKGLGLVTGFPYPKTITVNVKGQEDAHYYRKVRVATKPEVLKAFYDAVTYPAQT